MEQMVVIVPINTNVDKAQEIAQYARAKLINKGAEIVANRYPNFKNHDCDDDRHNAIAERFKSSRTHLRIID